MTSPPPIVPAPPPVAAAPPVAPAPPKAPPAPKTAAAPPPLIPAHRRVQAAGVGGAFTAAGSTAGGLGAASAGLPPAVGVMGAVATLGVGAASFVAVRRRMHRPVTAAAPATAKPGLRARAGARRESARERRGKLTERIRGAMTRRRGSQSPAGPALPRGRARGGAGPSRRRLGRQAPGGHPRSPGAAKTKGGGRLARAMPTRAGKAARAQRKAERAGKGRAPTGSPSGGRTPKAAGAQGRSRLGRAWDRRPTKAGRAARAAGAGGSTGGSTGKPSKAALVPAGWRARRSARRAARNAPPTVAAPPTGKASKAGKKDGAVKAKDTAGKTPEAAATPKTPAPAVPAAPTVWSTRRRDRRNPNLPAVTRPPRRGLRARAAARYAKHTRTGSTAHTPWQDGDPPKGGGVGPVPPKDGPKPGSGPSSGSKEKPAALGDDELWAWVGRREQAKQKQATPGAEPARTPEPARSRRQELADSQWGPGGLREDAPQTDKQWAAGFTPGAEPLVEDARTAARKRWQDRSDKGATMPEPLGFHNARRDPDGEVRSAADADPHFYWNDPEQQRARRALDDATRHRGAPTGPSRGGGSGEIADMRTDMPRFEAAAAGAAEGLAADFRRRAAEVGDGTPSSQAVKDAWEAIAVQQSAVAQATTELAGMSQRVDAAGHDAGERYGHDPNFGKWAGR